MKLLFNKLNSVFLISVLTFIITIFLYYSFSIGFDIAEKHSPLVHSVMEIKLEGTLAHLTFEEIICGDKAFNIQEVWEHFDKAKFYASSVLRSCYEIKFTII